jgi:hypothetical protein
MGERVDFPVCRRTDPADTNGSRIGGDRRASDARDPRVATGVRLLAIR